MLGVVLAGLTGCGGDADRAVAASGELHALKGDVRWIRGAESHELAPDQGSLLAQGDRVVTGPGGEAVITWGGQVHVMSERSELGFDAMRDGSPALGPTEVSLLKGSASFFLPRSTPPRRFQVRTKSLIAGVKGTVFTVAETASGSRVTVLRGEVDVSPVGSKDPSGARPVATKQWAHLVAGQVTVEPLGEEEAARMQGDLLLKQGRLKLDLVHF